LFGPGIHKRVILDPGTRDYGMVHFLGFSPFFAEKRVFFGKRGVFALFAVLRAKRLILDPGTRDYGMVQISGKSPKRGSFLANSGEFRVWEVRMLSRRSKKKDLFLRAPRTILRRIIRRMTFTSFMSLLCTSMSMSRHDDLTNSSTRLSHQHRLTHQ